MNFVKRLADDLLARRVARTLDVGRVAHQREHALLAQLDRCARRSIISPETGVRSILKSPVCTNGAERRVDGQRDGIRRCEWFVWMNSI
ncbi:MAG: hypothetical protein ACLUNO_02970 [Oscillospiraceae bacterium]